MTVERLMGWEVEGETEELGEIQPQCFFVHPKSHMALQGIEAGSPLWEAGY
jgi:hypothetical protein